MAGPPDRTTSTGHGALRTTCSDTLPSSSRPTAPRPWLPTTIMSARSASAASTIWSPGSPVQTRNDRRRRRSGRAPRAPARRARAAPHLVDAAPEPAARQLQRARVDHRDREQPRAEPRRPGRTPVGRRRGRLGEGPWRAASSCARSGRARGAPDVRAPDHARSSQHQASSAWTIASTSAFVGHDDQRVDHAEHPVRCPRRGAGCGSGTPRRPGGRR